MQQLALSFNLVFPLFCMMLLGYLLRHWKVWDEHTVLQINKIIFKVFFPLHLFTSIYHTDLENALNGKLLAYSFGGVLLLALVLCLVVPLFTKDNRRRGALVQGIFRSNLLLFGIPIVSSLYGEEGMGSAALAIALVVPLYNVLAVVVLELFRGGKPDFKKMLKGVVTNPLIIGALCGILALALRIPVPSALDKAATDLAKVATPLALMVLGGTFQFAAVRSNKLALVGGLAARLILAPAALLTVGALLGFRGLEMAVLLAVFASPTAVSSFTMAEEMDSDAELAGHLVVFSAVFSIVTIFGWVYLMQVLHWL